MDDGVREDCNKSLTNLDNCTSNLDTVLTPEVVAVPLTFAIIFVFGLTSNILLICAFVKYRALSTPHNVFVINLAAGDLLMLIVSLPFNSTWYTFPSWLYGGFICKVSHFAETMATAVVIFTLTVLSAERFFIISGRHRTLRKRRYPLLVVIIVWMFAFCISIPDLISATIESFYSSGKEMDFCLAYSPSWGQSYPMINVMLRFLLLFVIPLCVITPFYLLTGYTVIFKTSNLYFPTSQTPLRPESQPNIKEEESSSKEKRKRQTLAIVVFCLVLAFVVCWFPRHIFMLWYHYDPGLFNQDWHNFKIVGFCLMFANSAINPLVFYILDRRFRRFVRCTLKGCRGCKGDTAARDTSVTVERQTIALTDLHTGGKEIDPL